MQGAYCVCNNKGRRSCSERGEALFGRTLRAAYQPAIPKNSEMFFRSVGLEYSTGAPRPWFGPNGLLGASGSRLPSTRGIDFGVRVDDPPEEVVSFFSAAARRLGGPPMLNLRPMSAKYKQTKSAGKHPKGMMPEVERYDEAIVLVNGPDTD